MGEKINLTGGELDALLGDVDISGGKDSKEKDDLNLDAGKQSASSDKKDLKSFINASKSALQKSLSTTLGDEIELRIVKTDETKGVSVIGSREWYVSEGSFSNDGYCEHIYVFSTDVAYNLVKQYSQNEDLENNEDNIIGPLTEICQNLVDSLSKSFGMGFKGDAGSFSLEKDPSAILTNKTFTKVEWKIGENSFFEFFNKDIDQFINGTEVSKTEASNTTDNVKSSDSLFNLDELTDEKSKKNDSSGISSLFGLGQDEDDSMSLGDTLLGTQSVNNAAFPSFDDSSSGNIQNANNPINMLMDVTMDVTVELGSTKKLIGDILDLNRGSIIELKKLAGEPLDIKINNKLIARGEVVVIDEYFGVRVIEIVSPNEKPQVS